jgi:DNA (cytosine-5)-methyltransferase 1
VNLVAYQCHGSNVGAMGTIRSGNGGVTGGVPFLARSLGAPENGPRYDAETETYIAHTLRAEGFDASEDGTGRGTPLVALRREKCYHTLHSGPCLQGMEDSSASPQERDAGEVLPDVRQEVGAQAVAQRGPGVPDSLQPPEVLQRTVLCESSDTAEGRSVLDDSTLPCSQGVPARTVRDVRQGGEDRCASQGWRLAEQHAGESGAPMPQLSPESSPFGVRRLTPRETERLQGFPDDWTRYRADGTEQSDSARYRQMGNAVCIPVVTWIAQRIMKAMQDDTAQ